jgi:hypothetical protein
LVDVVAREVIPRALQIADKYKDLLSKEERKKFEDLLNTPI